MVTAADQLASSAGVSMLERGGSAADAMVAAAAVMAVVGPHLCGLGGDALAMVKAPGAAPEALLAVGRAGSGADPDRLRAEGHADMPLRGDIRSVPVPGAVDGWLALHERYGRLAWDAVLEPAIALAEDGFAASLILAFASHLVAEVPGASQLCPGGPLRTGAARPPPRCRPDASRNLASGGRDGFYGGEFGRALAGARATGSTSADDLDATAGAVDRTAGAAGLRPRPVDRPSPSQGYLTLAGAWIADQVGIPADPADPLWPHLIAEAGRAASFDRPSVLFDGADGAALLSLDRLGPRAASIDPDRARVASSAEPPTPRPGRAPLRFPTATPRTCAPSTRDGLGISLTQSNALDFGAHLVAGEHRASSSTIVVSGSPSSRAIPPSTARAGVRPTRLSPALVTRPDGSLAQIIGTMGGDVQPQILLQLLARLLHAGEDPASAISAARVVHEAPGAPPFRLWQAPAQSLLMESNAPEGWHAGPRVPRAPGAGGGGVQPGRRRVLADHLRRDRPAITSSSPGRRIPAVPTATPWGAEHQSCDPTPVDGSDRRGQPRRSPAAARWCSRPGSLIQICTVPLPCTAR